MQKFTELVVLWSHVKVGHEGLRGTLAEFRSRYWITKGRQFVKKVIRQCVICNKLEVKAYKALLMGPLPDFRVTQSPAFSKVGIDFAGPLYVKGQSGSMEKVYIALFSCCTTRAIHLELVKDLTAHTFLKALHYTGSQPGEVLQVSLYLTMLGHLSLPPRFSSESLRMKLFKQN